MMVFTLGDWLTVVGLLLLIIAATSFIKRRPRVCRTIVLLALPLALASLIEFALYYLVVVRRI
jgi:hypothetical protein